MLKLLLQCLIWSAIGRLLRTIAKLTIIFSKSLNDYLGYLEAIWHFDNPRFFKTIYLNFRVCDTKTAFKCPIYVYGKTRIWSLNGKVYFDCKSIYSGMIKWGYDWGYRSNGITIIRIEGEVHFAGKCLLAQATDIAVFQNAVLSIGEGGKILENSLIYCTNNINIGRNFSFTFQSSMMDTNFHYLVDIGKSRVPRKTAPIYIGDNVWVGNRATIKKGVVVPDNTIIAASYSVLTKDYSSIPPYSILGGCPAKLLSSGYSRVWKNEMDNSEKFDKYFREHIEERYVEIEKISDYIYECK